MSANALVAVPESGAAPNAAAKAPAQAPQSWDPRVEQYIRFVEHDRELKFEHPVPVAFLSDAAFVEELNKGGDLTKQDRADAKHQEAQLRALGLIAPGVDLLESAGALDDTTTTGFYDSETEKLYVRGDDLSDTEVRITIVHELTHALQDQHFDLDELDRRTGTSGEGCALNALIEGDATTVEDDYLASLPQAEQDAYDASLGEPLGENVDGTTVGGVGAADSAPCSVRSTRRRTTSGRSSSAS